jgi:peptidoglycan/LPS O-acetylase OafA/YrhL
LITAKRFFILRFSRLYPLHLATLFLVAILQLVYTKINHSPFVYDGNDRFHFLLQLFMASNWRGSWGFTFNGPVWSVSVEVLVYFFFYLTLRYCGGSAVINCLVIFACVVASRLGITWHLVECLCLFYAGGLAAIIAKSVESKDAKKITFRVCWALVFFAPITLIFVSNHSARGFSKDDWSWLLVFYAPILCMALSQPVSLSATTHRIVEAAGNMTYSSYLLHFPMQLCVATVCIALGIEIPARSPFFFAGYLLFVLIISRFAFRYFEMPAQDAIRSRFVPSSAFVHGAGNASGAATYRSGQPL